MFLSLIALASSSDVVYVTNILRNLHWRSRQGFAYVQRNGSNKHVSTLCVYITMDEQKSRLRIRMYMTLGVLVVCLESCQAPRRQMDNLHFPIFLPPSSNTRLPCPC